MGNGVSGYFDIAGTKTMQMRVYYQETYDIESNASTVEITNVEVLSTAYIYTYWLNGTVTIGDTAAVTMNSAAGSHHVYIGKTNTWYPLEGTLGSVGPISHNADGSCTATISVEITGYTSDGGANNGWKVSGIKSVALTTIPRTSTLTVPETGTLGELLAIQVDRKAGVFRHTLTYSCGADNGVIADKEDAAAWSFLPPLDLAWNNPNGTGVVCAFTLTTYSAETAVGTDTKYVTLTIPPSVAPSCSLDSVYDAKGYAGPFGGFIKGQSKIGFLVSHLGSYGSTIVSCNVFANGAWYSGATGVTDTVKTVGTNTVTATVMDSRGRTATVSSTIEVLDYVMPRITRLAVHRCDADGMENMSGKYIEVSYDCQIYHLENKNTKEIWMEYKKSTDSSFTRVNLPPSYSVTNGTYLFAADDDTSYEVWLYASDYFTTAKSMALGSTAFAIIHFAASGKGIAFGKLSEMDAFEVGMDAVFYGNVEGITYNMVGAAPAGFGLGQMNCDRVIYSAEELDNAKYNGWCFFQAPGSTLGNVALNFGSVFVMAGDNNSVYQEIRPMYSNTVLTRYFWNGAWSEWECLNPPMLPGVEYRTMERSNGKAVYAQAFDIGAIPAATLKTVAHGVAMTSVVDKYGTAKESPSMFGYNFPLKSYLYGEINLDVNYDQIMVWTNTEDWTNATGIVYVKYTKD